MCYLTRVAERKNCFNFVWVYWVMIILVTWTPFHNKTITGFSLSQENEIKSSPDWYRSLSWHQRCHPLWFRCGEIYFKRTFFDQQRTLNEKHKKQVQSAGSDLTYRAQTWCNNKSNQIASLITPRTMQKWIWYKLYIKGTKLIHSLNIEVICVLSTNKNTSWHTKIGRLWLRVLMAKDRLLESILKRVGVAWCRFTSLDVGMALACCVWPWLVCAPRSMHHSFAHCILQLTSTIFPSVIISF